MRAVVQLALVAAVFTELPADGDSRVNASSSVGQELTADLTLDKLHSLDPVEDASLDDAELTEEPLADLAVEKNGSALEMFGSRRRSIGGGGGSWSSPRRRSGSSWNSPRRRSTPSWSSPRRRSVHVHIHEHYYGGSGYGYGPSYYDGGYYVGGDYIGGTVTVVVLTLIMIMLCLICVTVMCTSSNSSIAPGGPSEPFLSGYQEAPPPLPVGPAPMQPQLCGAFIVALRREYVDDQGGAVGVFLDSQDLTEDVGRVLEQVEDIVRSQPSPEDRQSAIDTLERQWMG